MDNKLQMIIVNSLSNQTLYINPNNINYLYSNEYEKFYIVVGNEHIQLSKAEYNKLFEYYIQLT